MNFSEFKTAIENANSQSGNDTVRVGNYILNNGMTYNEYVNCGRGCLRSADNTAKILWRAAKKSGKFSVNDTVFYV